MSDVITKIQIRTRDDGGQEWAVPRGFGREYQRHAKLIREADDSVIVELLELIGYTATEQQIAGWDLRRRVEASVYAANVHLRASDNAIQQHPRPAWLPERPWQGLRRGTGVFAGPGPTVIP